MDQEVARAGVVVTEEIIMHIATGFNEDLDDASIVYERLMDVQDRPPMTEHALTFLRSCMIAGDLIFSL